ncbi:MAG: phosphoribosylformylglycinamidine synthase, partial [Bacteroidia bacterium]|nr:phosphoribosylformylglycinamidine synthase [Bacteroidia bacterium]
PMYTVGDVTGDNRFTFESASRNAKPMDLALSDMFGSSPQTIMKDTSIQQDYKPVDFNPSDFYTYLDEVLQLEAVACKDWLTNKVDRCVGGKVAKQQCAGQLQLPLNNCGVSAIDFNSKQGIATSIGHSPISGLIDPVAGSRNSITEALTNIIWAPIKDGIKGVSLSANWMWPCKNEGEDARLYEAVKAVSEFSIALGINVPTGKDSLSMKQKYPDGEVLAPGTVIISAAAHCDAIDKVVEPVFRADGGPVYHINISQDDYRIGGSSFAQIRNRIGPDAPNVKDANYLKVVFNTIQDLIRKGKILAGHDVASGGLITTLLEMCFAEPGLGAELDLSELGAVDSIKMLFAENASIVFQATDSSVEKTFEDAGISAKKIGHVNKTDVLSIINNKEVFTMSVSRLRDVWYKTSVLLDQQQTAGDLAKTRFETYKKQPLVYKFPDHFNGRRPDISAVADRPKAAVLREKGSNSERELANIMHMAGFDVKDVHMTDLISGRETLEDIKFIGAVGGFSNSDVLGSAKGWAGAFLYNDKANNALQNFFKREDTLSIGICNGCQLFMELEEINPDHEIHGKMTFNDSHKHESAFTSVTIKDNNSVMLSTLAGTTLGVWISHGEGKFDLPYSEDRYNIIAKYGYADYPANPNGSDFNTAMMCDASGRHLVTMPHIERSTYPWNWAYYPEAHKDDVSPWVEAFVNARKWIEDYH